MPIKSYQMVSRVCWTRRGISDLGSIGRGIEFVFSSLQRKEIISWNPSKSRNPKSLRHTPRHLCLYFLICFCSQCCVQPATSCLYILSVYVCRISQYLVWMTNCDEWIGWNQWLQPQDSANQPFLQSFLWHHQKRHLCFSLKNVLALSAVEFSFTYIFFFFF